MLLLHCLEMNLKAGEVSNATILMISIVLKRYGKFLHMDLCVKKRYGEKLNYTDFSKLLYLKQSSIPVLQMPTFINLFKFKSVQDEITKMNFDLITIGSNTI